MLTIASNYASVICIDNNLDGLVDINAACLFYPNRLSTRTRNAVVRYINDGVRTSYSGVSAAVYRLLCELRGAPDNAVCERWMKLAIKPDKLLQVEEDLAAFMALQGVRYENHSHMSPARRSYVGNAVASPDVVGMGNIYHYGVVGRGCNRKAAEMGVIDIVRSHLTITQDDKDWMLAALKAPSINLRYKKCREEYTHAG
jgi:hypothetical protein